MEGEASGEHAVDHQSHDNADAGIEDAVQGIGDIALHRSVEEDDAKHHAAGLDASHPEDLAQQNQRHGADEHQGHQQQRVAALRIEEQVNPEEGHAQKPADGGAEEAVSAVELGIFQIAAHAEDGADAGEGGTAVQKIVDQSTERGGQSRLDIAHSDFGKAAGGLAGWAHENLS